MDPAQVDRQKSNETRVVVHTERARVAAQKSEDEQTQTSDDRSDLVLRVRRRRGKGCSFLDDDSERAGRGNERPARQGEPAARFSRPPVLKRTESMSFPLKRTDSVSLPRIRDRFEESLSDDSTSTQAGERTAHDIDPWEERSVDPDGSVLSGSFIASDASGVNGDGPLRPILDGDRSDASQGFYEEASLSQSLGNYAGMGQGYRGDGAADLGDLSSMSTGTGLAPRGPRGGDDPSMGDSVLGSQRTGSLSGDRPKRGRSQDCEDASEGFDRLLKGTDSGSENEYLELFWSYLLEDDDLFDALIADFESKLIY